MLCRHPVDDENFAMCRGLSPNCSDCREASAEHRSESVVAESGFCLGRTLSTKDFPFVLKFAPNSKKTVQFHQSKRELTDCQNLLAAKLL